MKSGPIIEATFDGFKDAFKTYWKWSESDLTGVERVATYCIANKIQALDSVRFVQLEQNARDTRHYGGGTFQGIGHKTVPYRARVDIAVFNSIPEVKCVIEIKTSNVSFSNLQADIDKICAVLKNAQSTQWGLVAYYQSLWNGEERSARERLKARRHDIFCRAEKYVDKKGFKLTRPREPIEEEYDQWAWCMEILKVS